MGLSKFKIYVAYGLILTVLTNIWLFSKTFDRQSLNPYKKVYKRPHKTIRSWQTDTISHVGHIFIVQNVSAIVSADIELKINNHTLKFDSKYTFYSGDVHYTNITETVPKHESEQSTYRRTPLLPSTVKVNVHVHYDPLDIVDFIVNPFTFKYTINTPGICSLVTNLTYLVYFHSAPDHFTNRYYLRQTWAKPSLFSDRPSRTVFFLGLTKNSDTQAQIQNESALYGDIIQEDYVDSYRNLTYKTMSAFKWISRFCPNVQYVIKADDDIVFNMYRWMYNISLSVLSNGGRFMYGGLFTDGEMAVIRDPKSKWYVAKTEHKRDTFASYYSGCSYIISGEIIPEMYNASLYTPFLWVDDAFIGIVVGKVKNVHMLSGSNISKLIELRIPVGKSCSQRKGPSIFQLPLIQLVSHSDQLVQCWEKYSSVFHNETTHFKSKQMI